MQQAEESLTKCGKQNEDQKHPCVAEALQSTEYTDLNVSVEELSEAEFHDSRDDDDDDDDADEWLKVSSEEKPPEKCNKQTEDRKHPCVAAALQSTEYIDLTNTNTFAKKNPVFSKEMPLNMEPPSNQQSRGRDSSLPDDKTYVVDRSDFNTHIKTEESLTKCGKQNEDQKHPCVAEALQSTEYTDLNVSVEELSEAEFHDSRDDDDDDDDADEWLKVSSEEKPPEKCNKQTEDRKHPCVAAALQSTEYIDLTNTNTFAKKNPVFSKEMPLNMEPPSNQQSRGRDSSLPDDKTYVVDRSDFNTHIKILTTGCVNFFLNKNSVFNLIVKERQPV
ncbi:unnamed protein product [Rodentolepis nana]|uniref:Protein TSSC4 n=1 Tax=Rodentolepis nana TaxID=102285 RepID=A0A0R3TW69_RODNA|nr:unnamed protein product [Rodentolepis nana]